MLFFPIVQSHLHQPAHANKHPKYVSLSRIFVMLLNTMTLYTSFRTRHAYGRVQTINNNCQNFRYSKHLDNLMFHFSFNYQSFYCNLPGKVRVVENTFPFCSHNIGATIHVHKWRSFGSLVLYIYYHDSFHLFCRYFKSVFLLLLLSVTFSDRRKL